MFSFTKDDARRTRTDAPRRTLAAVVLPTVLALVAAGCLAMPAKTTYPVPTGSIIVSPSGNDAAAGTVAAPVRTLKRAVQLAPAGATIVLRAGEYHEDNVKLTRANVTIQSWPGEAVWLDGSVPVTSWTKDGARWRHDGWTFEPDASPTWSRGAPDGTSAGWQWVNPSYPMAAHPDQIFIDGEPQWQVASLAQVVPGTFFHDRGANRLWLGTDPKGREVRVSALGRAIMVSPSAKGAVIRGIGIRRHAPSVPDFGSLTVSAPDVTIEHVTIEDSATAGMHVGNGSAPYSDNVTLRNVWVRRSGLIGINANRLDNFTLDRVLAQDNNTQRFNTSPVAGGVKITRARNLVVKDSIFHSNHGTGLWMDESVHDMTIVGNQMRDNANHGGFFELSGRGVFANNTVTDNRGFGLKVNNTSFVEVWNNTFSGNGSSIWIVQDARTPVAGLTNPRDPNNPEMNFRIGPAVVSNNVFADQQQAPFPNNRQCLVCVEDVTDPHRTGNDMDVTLNGNVYHRVGSTSPKWVVWWTNHWHGYMETWAAFRSATGQESNGHYTTNDPVNPWGTALAPMPPHGVALSLPAHIAAKVGEPTGTRHFGAFAN